MQGSQSLFTLVPGCETMPCGKDGLSKRTALHVASQGGSPLSLQSGSALLLTVTAELFDIRRIVSMQPIGSFADQLGACQYCQYCSAMVISYDARCMLINLLCTLTSLMAIVVLRSSVWGHAPATCRCQPIGSSRACHDVMYFYIVIETSRAA